MRTSEQTNFSPLSVEVDLQNDFDTSQSPSEEQIRPENSSSRSHNGSPSLTGGKSVRTSSRYNCSPLSKFQAVSLISDFRDEILTTYTFVDLGEISELLDQLYNDQYYTSTNAERANPTQMQWNNLNDVRNIDFLKVVLACSMVAKEKHETLLSRDFTDQVESESCKHLRFASIEVKDVAIMAMLVIQLRNLLFS